MKRLKALMAVLLACLLALVTRWSLQSGARVLTDMYSDIYFTRLSVEVRRFTRQIEYGLENGKELDNFYNIESVLTNVSRCSSYIDGVYIISSDLRLLYCFSGRGSDFPKHIVPSDGAENGASYTCCCENGRYIVSIPIFADSGAVAGYMTLTLKNDVIRNQTDDIDRENLISGAAVAVLSWLAGLVAMIHFCRRRERLLTSLGAALTGVVCGSVVIGSLITIMRLQFRITGIVQQSVSRITAALQSDLTSVAEKGVSPDRIYDLNIWLSGNGRDIPFIETIMYDRDYRISALISRSYIADQSMVMIWNALLILGVCLAGGAAVIAASAAADKLIEKRRNGGNDRSRENGGSN